MVRSYMILAATWSTADVISLAAGEVANANVRLPLSAELPSMGAIIVAIDSAVHRRARPHEECRCRPSDVRSSVVSQ